MKKIYVLKCKGDRYYIGSTENFEKRINDHFEGKGSYYTRKYPPEYVVESYTSEDPFDEDKTVKKYMATHGIDNVRGGVYSQITLSQEQISHVVREIRGALNLCLKCGIYGHYIGCCQNPASTVHLTHRDFPDSDEEPEVDVVENQGYLSRFITPLKQFVTDHYLALTMLSIASVVEVSRHL